MSAKASSNRRLLAYVVAGDATPPSALGDEALVVEAKPGRSLSDCLHTHGIPIASACGGRGTCGSCRVRLGEGSAALPPSSAQEQAVLNRRGAGPEERLACQVLLPDGLLLEVVSLGRSSPRSSDKAGVSLDRAAWDPWPSLFEVELDAPTTAATSDLDRLRTAVSNGTGRAVELPRPAQHLPTLAELLGEVDRIVAVLAEDRLVGLRPTGVEPVGLAVDIGTTTIAVYAADLASGEILAVGTQQNLQARWGDDLMSRLTAAPEHGRELQSLAWDGVRLAVVSAARVLGLSLEQLLDRVVDMTVVANSAMHHLAFGLPTERLARAPYVPVACEPLEFAGADLADWFPPWLPVRALPLVAAFVGSDVSAGMVAAGLVLGPEADAVAGPPPRQKPLTVQAEVAFFVDIGTNAEMVLLEEGRAWACSAAAGPALEGARLSCGSAAGPGVVTWAQAGANGIMCRTWDGGRPVALSGTGALSLLASLRAGGWIDEHGLFTATALDTPWAVETSDGRAVALAETVSLTEADIAELLLARAALVAGRSLLLERAGRVEGEIETVYIAGTFGSEISVEDLARLAMVPSGARGVSLGNAAGEGALLALARGSLWRDLHSVTRAMSYVELSGDPLFESRFVDALALP